jgi:pantetheine-phosphate adenylyltransferase
MGIKGIERRQIMSIAIYAGSFDPITTGHLSIIRQASKLFGHVIVLVAHNPAKNNMFSCEDRVRFIEESTLCFPNVSIDSTSELVIDYAKKHNVNILIRGVRGASDIMFEMGLAQVNKALAPEISTVFLPADIALSEVSSSALKERVKNGEDISIYCLPNVAKALHKKV